MKFSIGYQLPDELDSTLEICRDLGEHISDVFFSWGIEPSGRFTLGTADEKEQIEHVQFEELSEIKKMDKKLTLLLNANCYGEDATSVALKKHILKTVADLKSRLDIDSVTTASPFIADILKAEFGASLEIKASVNMRIGSVNAIKQLSASFDGFYIKKELNRRFDKIEELLSMCNDNGKKLHILANSGCLTDCAFQTFHDNLIAHGRHGEGIDNVNTGFSAPCHKYLHSLKEKDAMAEFMKSNWIRPEEVHLYEKYFSEMKLATRMHSRPRMVIAAYCRGKFKGNLLDLTEPSYSRLFKGSVIDNTLIPESWFEKASSCEKNCDNCGACEEALTKATVKFYN